MKRVLKVVLFALMAFVLAACGGDDGGGDASDANGSDADNSAETAETGFTATVTGAEETEVTGRGYFMCDESIPELVVGASGSMTNNILILLPFEATAGTTYDMVSESFTGEEAAGSYAGESIQEAYFDSDVTGSITLDAVPSQPGEQVAGSFEFTASSNDDETVTVTGEFDFEAGSTSFANCE